MKAVVFCVVLFAFAFVVVADCTDSDGGPLDPAVPKPFIAQAGDTTVKSTTLSDYCMQEKQGKKVKEGPWIKEYYCVGALVLGKDYNCKDYGYEKCKTEGNRSACVGGGQASPATTPLTAAKPPKPKVKLLPHCGDKSLNVEGEECDPPGRLCVKEGQPGVCTDKCMCSLYKSKETGAPDTTPASEAPQTPTPSEPTPTAEEKAQAAPPVANKCGDGLIQEGEQCEKDSDCTIPLTCQSCTCKQGAVDAAPQGVVAKIWRWLNMVFS